MCGALRPLQPQYGQVFSTSIFHQFRSYAESPTPEEYGRDFPDPFFQRSHASLLYQGINRPAVTFDT